MNDIAFVFPGQGSQQVGMGRWLDAFSEAAALFDAAEEQGFDARAIAFDGPADILDRTDSTQPAILTVSLATLALLQARGIACRAVAGHSVGEYAALAAAGVLSFESALKLVRRRGALMMNAGKNRAAGMLAMIGVEVDILEAICAEASHEDEIVVIANYNCPGQVVVSGDMDALTRATEMAKAAGAKRVVPLRVASAFHSPLMEEAEDEMRKCIEEETFLPPKAAFYANVTGYAVQEPDAIRQLLAQQITSPVLWEQTIRQMVEDGIGGFVEVGAGKVLSGLIRRIVPRVPVLTTDTPEAFDEVVNVLTER
jgi:[acyl-carrier-protein] S-malonyltransferase